MYWRSMCTSLKWITWNGACPEDTHTFGFDGAGDGKGTVYGLMAGCWHSPKTEAQSSVLAEPVVDICRRSCAMMGPCSLTAPWHTSSSSSCIHISIHQAHTERDAGERTFKVWHTATIVSTKMVSPSFASSCRGTMRRWQPVQSTAPSSAWMISDMRLADTSAGMLRARMGTRRAQKRGSSMVKSDGRIGLLEPEILHIYGLRLGWGHVKTIDLTWHMGMTSGKSIDVAMVLGMPTEGGATVVCLRS